jgi:LPPG:FO 2-phospho-L-lactate transferase
VSAPVVRFPVQSTRADATVVALCGGVGGAKLAHGLYQVLPPDTLTIVANTGDDFQHLGLHISPDLDTVLYTLGGRADRERGWGRANETWNFMAALGEIGGEQWFNIGDLDLAMHVERTHWLQWRRKPLSAFAEHVAAKFGIAARIAPMTDDMVATWISTEKGLMPFQHYFVKERCEPAVTAVHFEAAAQACVPPAVQAALRDPRLQAIVICPSNPYLSIDPILAIPGMRTLIAQADRPVIAVSPIIGGGAVKGPAAKIMSELAIAPSWTSIARHYAGLADGLLIDDSDQASDGDYPLMVESAAILMKTLEDRRRLGETVLALAAKLRAGKAQAGTSPPELPHRM